MSDTAARQAPQLGAVPFEEAIGFLRDKLRLTSRGWTDVWQEQNAVAFTVAGAQSSAMVADFHQAVTRAITEGTTLADFRKDFDRIVAQYGWSYRGERGWRTRVIFETNLRTAYAAGRWQQAWDLREDRPFLRYTAVLDNRTRAQHRAWHGTVLPIEAAWWRTHYPPNGWGCRCMAMSLSARDLARRGWKVTDPEPLGGGVPRRVETPDGFRMEEVPPGIDPGWAYNVGEASQRAQVAQRAARQLGAMPADLGAAVGESMAEATKRALAEDLRGWVAARAADGLADDGSWRAVGALPPPAVAAMEAAGAPLPGAGVAVTARALPDLVRGTTAEILAEQLPRLVDTPDAVLRDRATGELLLVLAAGDGPPLVARLRLTIRGAREARAAWHAVRAVERTPPDQLRDPARFELVDGAVPG